MSHYDDVLKEARAKATGSAKEYIPRLYNILVDEEHKTPEDARRIIEHDLLEYWSKATVTKFLPHETKDEIKQEAGKKGAEKKKILLLADGSRAGNIPAEPEKQEVQRAREVIPDLELEDDNTDQTELEFLRDENRTQKETILQLGEALKKATEFKPASQVGFTKEDVGLDTVVFRMGIKDPKRAAEVISNEMTEFIKKDLTGLRNRGWGTVEVTMRIL